MSSAVKDTVRASKGETVREIPVSREASTVEVTRIDTGWSIRINDTDPETKYLPPGSKTLDRISRVVRQSETTRVEPAGK